jgi:tRNA G18 (ribose-2'-O)-methylase SpoU
MTVVVTDPADPRLVDYLGLTDVARRSRHEPEAGFYIAESEKVIRRSYAAGHRPRSMLVLDRALEPLADLVAAFEADGAEVFAAATEVIDAVTGFHVHRGALASMARPAAVDPAELLARRPADGSRPRVAVFEDLADTTNLGAAFRSSAGLGVDAVLLTPRCADPLYRRAVRVSMGTVFQVPWARFDRWPDDLDLLREKGFRAVALGLVDGAVPLDELVKRERGPLAMILGTEGAGLAPQTLARADVVCRIPMAGGVDSLNVAAAAAVAFWATR